MVFGGTAGLRTSARRRRGTPRQIAVPPALRCPKKSSHYSFARFFRPLRILRLASSATGGARLRIPIPREAALSLFLLACGGASLIKDLICTPAGGAFVKKFVITSGGVSLINGLVSTPTRRGLTFVRAKVSKTRLGRCPKTPVAGCAGYGLICGGSRKSIRTAHRYAPKVATGVSALSPHPLSRWRERGSDGLIKSRRQFGARGMLGFAKTASR